MLNNAEFQDKFGIFIRDYVLSAKESEHLIEIEDKEAFVNWVNNWTNNTYIGNSFNFYKHIYFELSEKYLCLSNSEPLKTTIHVKDEKDFSCLSFPSEVFLLVAYRKESKSIFSRNQLLAIHDTKEFEIIFRGNSNLVSV